MNTTKIYIMVGPPCSGKSTLSKKMLEYDKNCIRVNRDDLRLMLKGYHIVGDYFVEFTINKLTEQLIGIACAARKDIIIDATHVKEKYINDIKKMIPETCNTKIKYILCDESLWKLKLRNIWRSFTKGIWIPTKVIKDMYHNFQITKTKIERGEL